MKQLLEHLKTYLQLHHDQNDGGVYINLIARINDELAKPELSNKPTELNNMKELLEKCGLFVSCPSDFTREERINLLQEIKVELEKPEPQIVGHIHPTVIQSLTESNTYDYIFSKEFEVSKVKSIPLIVKQ